MGVIPLLFYKVVLKFLLYLELLPIFNSINQLLLNMLFQYMIIFFSKFKILLNFVIIFFCYNFVIIELIRLKKIFKNAMIF